MNDLIKYFATTHIASYCEVNIPTTINWTNMGLRATFKTFAGDNRFRWGLFNIFREKIKRTHVSIYINSAYIEDEVIQELNELNINVIVNKSVDYYRLINKHGKILA